MPDTIRLAVIDDHPLYLAGVERTFGRVHGMTVVATGATHQDAEDICERERIDVMLLDIGIPGGGMNALRNILSKHPSTKVVMLTGSDDEEHIDEALALGAHGYVLKGANSSELRDAVLKVAGGEVYVTASVATRLLVQRIRAFRDPRAADGQPPVLNFQEQRIFDLVCQGLTNREIAQKLNLSAYTVRNYVSKILRAMNARNRIMAIQSVDKRKGPMARKSRGPSTDEGDG